jgi:hypothetical protein
MQRKKSHASEGPAHYSFVDVWRNMYVMKSNYPFEFPAWGSMWPRGDKLGVSDIAGHPGTPEPSIVHTVWRS